MLRGALKHTTVPLSHITWRLFLWYVPKYRDILTLKLLNPQNALLQEEEEEKEEEEENKTKKQRQKNGVG